MILAGDIGGTKTNLAIHTAAGKKVRAAKFRSRDYPGPEPLLREFLGSERITAASLGIAGPVLNNTARTPNLPWDVDGNALGRNLGIPVLTMINDLVATAEGIPSLEPDELRDLNPAAEPQEGNAVLIAPGTGLGMAVIDRRGGTWRPHPSEGGHQNFGPRDAEQVRLLTHLQDKYDHVSVERIVSGPGLGNIYRFLVADGQTTDAGIADRIAAGDPAPEIVTAGLAGTCPACVGTLRLFLACFGNTAANLALIALATGGVFIGGGVAPRLGPALDDGTFLAAFTDKGRLGTLLEKVPVRLVLNPRAAVLGAARHAQRMLEAQP